MLGCGSASCEKRQRGRWRSCWWCQVGQGGGALFLIAQKSQDSIDGVLVLDTCDDFYRPAAVAADFDVYVEYSLEPLSPGHGGMALSR